MTHKLAVGIGVVFCTFVAILLLILYYPKDVVEEEFDAAFTPGDVRINSNEEQEKEEEASSSNIVEVARHLEDFGAAFLALLAVGCIVAGLGCLACACCCIIE